MVSMCPPAADNVNLEKPSKLLCTKTCYGHILAVCGELLLCVLKLLMLVQPLVCLAEEAQPYPQHGIWA